MAIQINFFGFRPDMTSPEGLRKLHQMRQVQVPGPQQVVHLSIQQQQQHQHFQQDQQQQLIPAQLIQDPHNASHHITYIQQVSI